MMSRLFSIIRAADAGLRSLIPAGRSRMCLLFAVFLLVCMLMTGAVSAAGPSGNWTDPGNYDTSWAGSGDLENDPYLIETAKQLAGIAVQVNSGTTYGGKYFELNDDIDLSEHYWTPIGNTSATSFQGTFNGNDKNITNMNVTLSSAIVAGLFGRVEGATIKNVSVSGAVSATLTGAYSSAGGLAGYVSDSIITDCHAASTVTSSSPVDNIYLYIGGLVGSASDSTITNCHATGKVTATYTEEYFVCIGGLVGRNDNIIITANCYATGAVTATGFIDVNLGGLIGYSEGSNGIENCYATGDVTADGQYAGGLVGYIEGSITNCYATGKVIASTSYTGGLAGESESSVTNSVALNQWMNVSSDISYFGRFISGCPTMENIYAWRHMELNISGSISYPVSEPGGNNATNASTLMIWGNQSFYEGLGWTFGDGGNWTMSTDPDYRLPILAWQSGAAPAGADALHLNKTHEVYAISGNGGTIIPSGKLHYMDGKSVSFTITGTVGSFTDNGANIKPEITGTTYTIPDVDRDHRIVANMPEVGDAKIIPYNTTVANVTFTLNTSLAGATGAWVNLTNISNPADISSNQISDAIAAGTPTTVQLTDLIPGQSYQLNITPLNITLGGVPVIYTHGSSYTAPVPEIQFENATTGDPIGSLDILIGDAGVVIRANITNTTYGELKNETVSWMLQGNEFGKFNEDDKYPYNITLKATAAGTGDITVTVSGYEKKTLALTSSAPVTYYHVTYDGNGNTSGTVPIDTRGYASGEIVTVLDNTGNLGKTGHTFNGWWNGSALLHGGDKFTITRDTTLSANWTANKTIVTLENYTTPTSGTITFTYDELVSDITPKPTRNGYTFLGWYNETTGTNGTGTQIFDKDGKIQTVAGYANSTGHWKNDTRTITLYANWTSTPPVPPVPPVPPQPSGDSGDGYSTTTSGTVSGTGKVTFGTVTGITGVSFAPGTTGTVILDSDPAGVTPPPDSYIVIDITGPAFEGYAQIEFSVPVALLTDRGLTVYDVSLRHFIGGKWVTLRTHYLGEERGAANYIAATQTFSPFAIVYEKGGAEIIESATPEPTAAPPESTAIRPEPAETKPAGTITVVQTSDGNTGDPASLPTLTQAPAPLCGALLGLLAAGVLLRRKD
ncbi:GLUG motif-containing protein [Methanocorpusculum vombati]|uniref:PGF-pre-PGF domain-containing protein n=1 Tax=Methanocorpusculum vombati TaxID=3002864 RepID=A0ABT4ILT6_9EURY|nr:GLUG motif-containing protein [Methanocorpusculum vombati]MCZ0862719.1 PGF-pre-PGF domain-containing protein [Methanocorpusculum vombati]MDE2534210.1 PGF-pre-PGF domain-containing protein [Methanocorpusculum sp.]MDE2547830.1 PGF-pre-PGF domain-containing protein [Methanocorpusculum sp.]